MYRSVVWTEYSFNETLQTRNNQGPQRGIIELEAESAPQRDRITIMSHVAARSKTTRESQIRAGKVFAVRSCTQKTAQSAMCALASTRAGAPACGTNARIARASSPAGNGSRMSISAARGLRVPRRSLSWTLGASVVGVWPQSCYSPSTPERCNTWCASVASIRSSTG
jgi:hypothetical protein